jgi:hypothetical protein
VIEVPRAQAALTGHAKTSQPRRALLTTLVDNARASVKQIRDTPASDQILPDLLKILNACFAAITQSQGNAQLRVVASTFSQQLDPPLPKIPSRIKINFQEAWNLSHLHPMTGRCSTA